ncbi:MAG: TIGR00282 family metallophosphoesterase [Chlamydiae bacterium]|nr:MAG: TIGR00282 family metallophosphoesterase [Chlamydiota bacterium]
MKILIIGDIVGRPGRNAVKALVPKLRDELKYDLFIANAENSAGGKGITFDTMNELLDSGVDVITTGDHVYQQSCAAAALDIPQVIRPLNYPDAAPGAGWQIVETDNGIKVAVVNLIGRVFMKPVDCPFKAIEKILAEIHQQTKIVVVDFHAEATSEKIAMGWFLDGRVSAVCGTHTHVQTADNRILANGTACLTDLGMTGARNSILGCEVAPVLNHFLTGMPNRYKIAKENVWLTGALIDIDEITGKAGSIELVKKNLN